GRHLGEGGVQVFVVEELLREAVCLQVAIVWIDQRQCGHCSEAEEHHQRERESRHRHRTVEGLRQRRHQLRHDCRTHSEQDRGEGPGGGTTLRTATERRRECHPQCGQ